MYQSDSGFTQFYGRGKQGCHTGPVQVFNIGQAEIWAGSYWEVNCSEMDFDLFVCANGDKGQLAPLVRLADERGILALTGVEIRTRLTPSFLTLEIPDGGAPGVGPRFWQALAKDLRDKRIRVVVYCQGGHGRTGTILACLAYYGQLVRQKVDVVKFLRKVYCGEAVETSVQITYLRQMGMTTAMLPSWHPVATVTPVQAPQVPPGDPIVAGAYGTPALAIPGAIAASEVTQSEIRDWEKEMIQEIHKDDSVTGWNDYSG